MLYIRTDMNDIIATGHVMRCLAIADAVKEKGEDVTFLLADENAVELITSRGYESFILNTPWDDMEAELEAIQEVIYQKEIDKILVDSYQVTERYLYELSKNVKVAYIDDINRFLYPVDLLICYANYWKKFNYTNRYQNIRLLLGLQYTPLRKVFQKTDPKEIKENIENLLIMTGGTDRFHIIENILESLGRKQYKRIDVICGSYYADYESLCEKYSSEKNIIIHKAVKDIEDYMIKADVAITAGGTTLYELCAVGTPSISLSFADNQLDNVLEFASEGIIDYAGDIRSDNVPVNILNCLDKFSKEKRYEQSRKMQTLVDGLGAVRIAEELIKF